MGEQWNKCQETCILGSSAPLKFHGFEHVRLIEPQLYL